MKASRVKISKILTYTTIIIYTQAREDIEKEQANAKKELQSQIMDIAMLAAKKIIMTGDQYDAKSGK